MLHDPRAEIICHRFCSSIFHNYSARPPIFGASGEAMTHWGGIDHPFIADTQQCLSSMSSSVSPTRRLRQANVHRCSCKEAPPQNLSGSAEQISSDLLLSAGCSAAFPMRLLRMPASMALSSLAPWAHNPGQGAGLFSQLDLKRGSHNRPRKHYLDAVCSTAHSILRSPKNTILP